MSAPSFDETLSLFADFLAREMGLRFSRERLGDLEQKLLPVARDQGFDLLQDYLLQVMSAPLTREQLDLLAGVLTIGETYFLRDPKSYQALEKEILPALVAARRGSNRTLRIWSAGCSSGEEPYSIAIVLSRAIPDMAEWKIDLLATDINPQALERGRLGVYSPWSFRNSPPWLMEYFSARPDGGFEIHRRIRDLVRFQRLNLAEPWSPPLGPDGRGVDVIFCRNVMLYFDPAQIEKTMAKFHAALNDGGWLFVGPTEVNHHKFTGFSCRHFCGALVLHRLHSSPVPLSVAEGAATPAGVSAAGPPLLPAHTRAETSPGARHSLPGAAFTPTDVTAAATVLPESGGYPEAVALYRAGRYREAAGQAIGSLESGGEREKAPALALAARALANVGSFDEARDCCEQAIVCDRLSADSYYLLAIIQEQLEDSAGAARSLKQALYIDHDYLLAYFALGNLSRQTGDRREAERHFAKALRLLERRDPQEVLEETEGMTAGGLAKMIQGLGARG